MKPEIGDKYIIEIDRAYASKKHAESRFGIKGFENFVLSKRNINDALKYKCIEDLVNHDAAEEHKGYKRGYQEGLVATSEIDRQMVYDKAYQCGLDDAWEAAKKIALPCDYGGIDMNNFVLLFDTSSRTQVMLSITPQEAIAKLREYEQKKAVKTNGQKFEEVFPMQAYASVTEPDWLDEPYKEPESEGEDE